jgi:alginate O-acetyltransferase complex protein AlgJ
MKLERAVYVQTVLFLTTIFIGFACIVAHFAMKDGRVPLAAMGWVDVADGAFTKKVDEGVVVAMPANDALNGLQAGVEYRVFNDAGPQVRAGCFGWLFLGEELEEVRNGNENMASHFAIARKVAADFASRRIALVMLTVPDKARVAATRLCNQRVSTQEQSRLSAWNQMTTTLALTKIDIVSGWPGKPGYWTTDTHWDREGARFAARRTAEAVRPLLAGSASETAVVSSARTPQVRPGDLMHLSNLEHAPPWLQPPPDMERPQSVIWQHGGGLLDAGPSADILLTGSSYSKNSGFIDYLGLALGHEVVQLSEEGGGFDGSLFGLLNKHRKELAHAKVVVWEFPERSLTQPLTANERSFLLSLNK